MKYWLLLLCVGCGSTPPASQCTDKDGDGYCADVDCDDNDASVFQLGTVYTDSDGDQLGTGAPQAKCVGSVAPRGFALQAGDCDDNYATCNTNCIDMDQDGVPQCAGDCDDANPYCGRVCIDADSDHHCADHDCNELSGLHWADCGKCVDSDSDGRGSACDLGGDCNNSDPNNWDACAACVDADHDGSFTGCNAYITHEGPDCDDAVPTCLNDLACNDSDKDGVRVCAGDCDDAGNPCIATASGGQSTLNAGRNGGTFTISADTLQLYNHNAPLPTGAFLGSRPAATSALLVVRATDPPAYMDAAALAGTWAGVEIERGAVLNLTGATGATFIINVTDHIYVAGTIASSATGADVTFATSTDGTLDVTLAGIVALTGAASQDGARLHIGTASHRFANAALLGQVALAGGDSASASGDGGGGGLLHLEVTGEVFSNTAIAVDGGAGIIAGSGGTVEIVAATVRLRGDGIAAPGGNAIGASPAGKGGSVSFATKALTAASSFFITANGGSAASTGGLGGTVNLTVQAPGAQDVTTPFCVASGGDATGANGVGGGGGQVQLSVGSGTGADHVLVQAPLEAIGGRGGSSGTGGAGGVLNVAANDPASYIEWNQPARVIGGTPAGTGGMVRIGAFPTLPPSGSYAPTNGVSLSVNASIDAGGGTGGSIDMNVATLSIGPTGDLSAMTGGQCVVRTGTQLLPDGVFVSQHTHDGIAGVYGGDLSYVDTP